MDPSGTSFTAQQLQLNQIKSIGIKSKTIDLNFDEIIFKYLKLIELNHKRTLVGRHLLLKNSN